MMSALSYRELIEGKSTFSFLLKSSHSGNVSSRMKNDYSGVSALHSNIEYSKLETHLKQLAQTYIQDYFSGNENKVVITLHTLQSKKITDSIYDSNRSLCNGYVIYDASLNLYTPYLRCGSYKSLDYVNHLE